MHYVGVVRNSELFGIEPSNSLACLEAGSLCLISADDTSAGGGEREREYITHCPQQWRCLLSYIREKLYYRAIKQNGKYGFKAEISQSGNPADHENAGWWCVC